jgi:hypothetical protein
MASAQAATSLERKTRLFDLLSSIRHQDVLHAPVSCFPTLERVLKFMFRMGEVYWKTTNVARISEGFPGWEFSFSLSQSHIPSSQFSVLSQNRRTFTGN